MKTLSNRLQEYEESKHSTELTKEVIKEVRKELESEDSEVKANAEKYAEMILDIFDYTKER